MTSLQIKSALLFSLMLSAAALSYAAHAAPAAAPAASAEPASGTMVMTARETPEAACARGEAAACTVAALRVLPSVDKARSEQKAVGEARALFEKGCRGGDPESCRHLGLLLAEGRIYSADLPAAKELLSRGCTIGDDRSCREMARIANDAGEHEALVSWLGKSCMLGNETSCMRTATLDRSDDRVRWVEEACRLGRMDACLDAAERRKILHARDVRKLLVDRIDLLPRHERADHRHHAVRHRLIELVVAREHRDAVPLGELPDLKVRDAPRNAERLRLGRLRHDAAVVVREDHHGAAPERGIEHPVHRGIEGVAVNVKKARRHAGLLPSTGARPRGRARECGRAPSRRQPP